MLLPGVQRVREGTSADNTATPGVKHKDGGLTQQHWPFPWTSTAGLGQLLSAFPNQNCDSLPTFLPLPRDREDLAELSGNKAALVGVTEMGLESL